MQTFLVEGSFLHRTASAFFHECPEGRHEKNKYTANIPVRKPCSFSAPSTACIFQRLPVDQVIFCPTHKYIRLYTEKSSPHVYADILNFRINFVIFEQFFHILRTINRKTLSYIKGKGSFSYLHQHRNCATNGNVTTEKIVETKVY